MKLVTDSDEVMLITEKGILMRTRVAEIRETGRAAAGVRLIKLDEGDKLVAMAQVEAGEEEGAKDPIADDGPAPAARGDKASTETGASSTPDAPDAPDATAQDDHGDVDEKQ
jgi:DNA gyrase subunit A